MKSDQRPEEVHLKPKGFEPRPISKPEGTDTSLPPKPPKRESLPPPDNKNSLSPDEVKNPTRDEAPPRMSSSRANYVALVLALIGWCIAGYLLIQKQSSSAASTRNSELNQADQMSGWTILADASFPPEMISILITAIAVIGLVAAIWAAGEIKQEKRALKKLENADDLTSLTKKNRDANEWLKEVNVKRSTHCGTLVLTVWDGWKKQRTPTLTELRSLCSQKERLRFSSKVSSFLAKVLVILGILGTLYLVHNVLIEFGTGFGSSAAGDVGKTEVKIKGLISALGRSFVPSLWALSGTVLIVWTQSFAYEKNLTKFAVNLDKYILSELLPTFTVKDQNTQLAGVQIELAKIADNLQGKDKELSEASKTLQEATVALRETTPKLGKEAANLAEAATTFTTKIESLSKSINRHFGQKSPIVEATNNFKEASERAQETATNLKNLTSHVLQVSEENSSLLKKSALVIKTATDSIPGEVGKVIGEGIIKITDATKNIAGTAGKSISEEVDKGAQKIGQTITEAANDAADRITDAGTYAAGSLARSADQIGDSAKKLDGTASEVSKELIAIKEADAALRNRVEQTLEDGLNRNTAQTEKVTEDLRQIGKRSQQTVHDITSVANKVSGLFRPQSFIRRIYNKVLRK